MKVVLVAVVLFLIGDFIASIIGIGGMLMDFSNSHPLPQVIGMILSIGTLTGLISSGFGTLIYLES